VRAIQAFRKSSSFTLSILFTSMLMMAVMFVTYILVIANDDLLVRESEAAINADILGFHFLHKSTGVKSLSRAINERIEKNSNDFFYHFRDPKRTFIAGNIRQWPASNTTFFDNGTLKLLVNEGKLNALEEIVDNTENINVIAKIITFDDGYQLLVGRNIEEIQLAQWVGKTFGWVMILILCLISAISIWVAHYVVNRINDISDKTDEIIATGDLTARLPIDSQWDDLSKLSLALNHMLEQFEASVASIRSVSDSIAHDLRTPLTRLKTHIEKLDEGDTKYALIKESDNLMSIFNSLLRIAEVETERKRTDFKMNKLVTLIEDVVDLYQPVIEAKEITLSVSTNLQISQFYCDKNLVFQAFANVIDNAVKFTPKLGEIDVSLFTTDVWNSKTRQSEECLVFSVFDTGIGVDAQDIQKLTQRFFRAEKSRTSSGNGLGLSLVSAVVDLHMGHLHFVDDPLYKGHGLGCVLTFPTYH